MVVASGLFAFFFTVINSSSVVAFFSQQYNSGFNYALASSSSSSLSSIARSRTLLLFVERSGSSSSSEKKATANLSQDELEKMMEYEYNEADFADYVSDYSANDDAFDDDEDVSNDNYKDTNNLDIRGNGGIEIGDSSSILSGYDESSYTSIGGFDLSPFEKHAREVFLTYALQVQSTLEYTDINLGSQIIANEVSNTAQQRIDNAAIMKKDLFDMLQTLDIDASLDESEALFKYLDIDDDGQVTLDEFLPWYAEAIDSAQQTAIGFQNLVKSRRTIHKFDATEVDDGVLRRALECAIAAPNRRGTEPWRFIKLGKETVAKVVKLRQEMNNNQQQRGITTTNDDEGEVSSSSSPVSSSTATGGGGVDGSFVSWTKVPHWIVVTYPKADAASGPDGKMQQREDFKSTCCAVQNLLLSMWSEGIGTKWTDGPIQRTQGFADICGIDLEKEKVAGVIWYGFARGGLNSAARGEVKLRRKGVEEVLDILP